MVPIDHFDTAAALTPDAVALVEGEVALTFAQVSRASHQIARAGSAGASPDEAVPVVVYSPNDHRVLVAIVGIMRAGGVVVPVHAGTPIETTVRGLDRVRPRYALFHSSLAASVDVLRRQVPSVQRWVCLDAPAEEADSLAAIATGDAPYDAAWIDASGNRDRPVYYWSTSGTTGEPKVVVDDVVSFDGTMMLTRARQTASGGRPGSPATAPLSAAPGAHRPPGRGGGGARSGAPGERRAQPVRQPRRDHGRRRAAAAARGAGGDRRAGGRREALPRRDRHAGGAARRLAAP